MDSKSVDIQIFGRSLKVNCPPEKQDELNTAVENLNKRLQELKIRTKVTNLEQLIFIVALNLCDELSQEKNKINNYILNFEKSIRNLKMIIEKVLTEQKNITELQETKFK